MWFNIYKIYQYELPITLSRVLRVGVWVDEYSLQAAPALSAPTSSIV
jgi:hypothetical protein